MDTIESGSSDSDRRGLRAAWYTVAVLTLANVSGFVDRQINQIEKAALHRIVRYPEKVDRQDDREDEFWKVRPHIPF